MYYYSFLLAAAGLTVLTAAGSLAAKEREPSVNDVRQGWAPRAYYTADWAVEITAGGAKMADLIAKRNGFTNLGEVDGLRDIYHFKLNAKERSSVPRSSAFTAKSNRLSSEAHVGFVEQQVVRPRVAKSYTVPEDPLFSSQWQLLNSGQLGESYAGNDMRVEQAWMQGITGCNATVTIVDDGLDFTHRDIWNNFVPEISYNFVEDTNDTSLYYPWHGTACGGIVGSLKDDRTCGVGVAHEVNLGGVALLGASNDINEARSLSYKRDIVDVYSNSWGPYDSGDNVDGPGLLTKMALENGVQEGRNGKGSIYVWANGNGGEDDDCAADGYASSPYTISVGAIGVDGWPSWFDEECSAKMVVTYVTNMYGTSTVSTTAVGGRCTASFGGTSAAAPLAAGVIALALEANPSLTWRDVQYLIVYTANPQLTNGTDTEINGAGLAVSRQYGFGVMDAEAMVTRARHWINVPPQMNDTLTPIDDSGSAENSSPFMSTINYSGSVQYLEHVIVTMTISNITDEKRGDIGASLSSPSGTVSTLLGYRRYDYDYIGYDFNRGYLNWPFMSVMFWGEDPTGQWTLTVTSLGNTTATISGIDFQFYGVSQVPQAVANIPDQCHSDCRRGCARQGSNFCDSCVNLRNAYSLDCINECPPGYTQRNGYCYDSSLPVEECNSPLKKKDEVLCADAGYTSCCTEENCEVSIETSPISCFCDALCHNYADCCSDILVIGCIENNVTEPCGILPYIALGVTEGVDTLSVPAFDDGVSEPIDVAFPIGYSIEPLVQVGTNGYFTFDGYDGFFPFQFDKRNHSLVAPFFTDIDISVGVGQIRYEVHRDNTSEVILSQVNQLINNCSEKEFTGNWLLVATWENVSWYGEPTTTSTFQGMLVTDAKSSNSYAVFTYYCGDLSHSTYASVGFGTEDGLHAVHEATFRGSGAHSIACLNQPTSPWVNIVYELTNNENECEVENGGCEQICLDKLYLYECSCRDGYELNSDGRTCSDANECLDSNGMCEHVCNNTKGSYLCSCEDGYALNEDGRTCSISCGGRLTEVSGSFHTPDWPLRYPTEDFVCEWVIDIENTTDSVIEITFNEPYGINGRDPCPTDYVEVLDGVEDNSPSLGKHCFWRTPAPILTSSNRAKVVFQGSLLTRPVSRVGVSVIYHMIQKVNECERGNGGCAHTCQDSLFGYSCHCREGFTLDSDNHNCSDIDECASDQHGCKHTCINSEGSFSCGCSEGYALNEDGRTCSISCGGRLTEVSGSFHTPDWPLRYPTEDFVCEWVIDIENTTDSVIEITFNEPYGINGRDPCPTDYVEVLDGVEDNSPSLEKHCFWRTPAPILTSSNRAKVVFQGSHLARSASRVGVSIAFTLKQKVNECENDNGGCAHSCQDSPGSYSCSCLNGFILGGDKHNCSDIDECSTNIHGCQQVCVNTEGSYSCGCRDGYALDDNGMTCSIICGGRLLDSSGSFQTPDWPDRYPQADFICEWTIDMSANSSIQFTVDSSAYGINGRHPCQNDHLEFFNGLESDSRSLGRFCKLEVPPPITTSTGAARIVFEGRVHQTRPASRKGVRVLYHVMD